MYELYVYVYARGLSFFVAQQSHIFALLISMLLDFMYINTHIAFSNVAKKPAILNNFFYEKFEREEVFVNCNLLKIRRKNMKSSND